MGSFHTVATGKYFGVVMNLFQSFEGSRNGSKSGEMPLNPN